MTKVGTVTFNKEGKNKRVQAIYSDGKHTATYTFNYNITKPKSTLTVRPNCSFENDYFMNKKMEYITLKVGKKVNSQTAQNIPGHYWTVFSNYGWSIKSHDTEIIRITRGKINGYNANYFTIDTLKKRISNFDYY